VQRRGPLPARIRLDEEELAKLGGQALVSGMPAETFIITGERTALSYLLKPFLDALARQGGMSAGSLTATGVCYHSHKL
jgi:hypothetical protein